SGQPLALPTLRADGGVLGWRWVAAASIAGLTHQADATTAQDSYCAGYSVDGSALVLAVCDGLGYREHTSQVGADLMARLCCAFGAWIVREQALGDGTEALIRAVEQANDRLIEMQRMHLPEWEPADLHCTVMLCRVPLTADGGPALFARAGDTEAFLLQNGRYATVFDPDTDAGPTNVVKGPLPHQNPREVLQVTAVDLDADALILTTDGLAHDIFDSPGTREWLAARWAVPCGPHRMLDALRYRRQSSHDDRTALVVWLRPWTGDEVDDAADHR
ncbi:protein phosphatase 2C domain-containing protein, partial [Nocardia sp. NPDC004722]